LSGSAHITNQFNRHGSKYFPANLNSTERDDVPGILPASRC
jgi:hypothetical protein